MSAVIRPAVLAALVTLAAAGTAVAADLDPHYVPPRASYGAPYDDPRYADVYRHPAPPAPRYVERYEERYTPPPPPRYEERYEVPPPPPAYTYREPPRRQSWGCIPREAARAALERQGWHDFHNLYPSGNVVHVRARRPNGAVFELTLDRCSGEIVERRFVAAPPPAYAWRDRPDLYPRY